MVSSSSMMSLFWKVSVSDVDSDGDTLNDWDEIQLGYNPNNSDTDRDGFPDNTDPLPLESAAWADRDGANLADSVNEGLIARWDFEGGGADNVTLVSTPDSGPKNAGPIDIANTNAGWDGRNDWPRATNGIPWACLHLTQLGAHAKVPTTKLANDTQTWAMWIKFDKPAGATAQTPGVLDSSLGRRTLISIGRDENGAGTTGDPLFNCYFDGKGTTSAADNKLTLSTWNSGIESELVSWNTPASLDDGNWHHIAIYFDDDARDFTFWFDGSVAGSTANGGLFSYTLNLANAPWCYLGKFKKNVIIPPPPATSTHETLGAKIDRLRVYNGIVPNATILALYNQDIDRDGLSDRFESQTRFWRDHNHDKIDQQSETTFPVSPFLNDPVGADHDGDGLSTHDEQTRGTNPWKADSDGDLLPDGWEVEHGSSPSDTDTLTALEEYRWGTDPNSSDTDGDGTSDSDEVNNGSHPNDPSDGGQPIPPAERLTFRIEVGDESGSHSEDYVVQCRRIDPETGEEKHVYTVRSGGFGGHVDQNYSMFQKGVTYTFQLDWQGTSNATSSSGSSDGPDYDYTFQVVPQTGNSAIQIDSWNKEEGTVDQGSPIQGDLLNDVAASEDDFRQRVENRRVAFVDLKVEWAAFDEFDNLSAHIDPWTNTENGRRIFPCGKNPSDTALRRKVKLVIKGGLTGVPVFAKSFDVDDTTSEGWDLSGIGGSPVIDTNGKAGRDNLVDYLLSGLSGEFWQQGGWRGGIISSKFDTRGAAEFHFRVSLQPGNNYRTCAGILDQAPLESVQVDDPNQPKYLGPETSGISGLAISPLLTVWRNLWVENDSMAGPPLDSFGYKRNDISADESNPRIHGASLTTSGNTLFEIYPVRDTTSFLTLENGKFLINSTFHPVLNTQSDTGSGFWKVEISGDHTGIAANSDFRLYDDDDGGMGGTTLPRLDLIDDVVKDSYKRAFIQVIDAADYNPRKTVDFYRNHPAVLIYELPLIPLYGTPGVWDDSLDLTDQKDLWTAACIAGYQGYVELDGDPQSEAFSGEMEEGGTHAERLYSVIFVENIREAENVPLQHAWPPDQQSYLENARASVNRKIRLTVAHEIGHMPGGGDGNSHHGELGLMGSDGYGDGEEFLPATIKRFRSTHKWRQP